MLQIRDMLLTRDIFPTKEWEEEYEFLVRKRDRYSDKIVRDDLDWLTFKKKAITNKLKYKLLNFESLHLYLWLILLVYNPYDQ